MTPPDRNSAPVHMRVMCECGHPFANHVHDGTRTLCYTFRCRCIEFRPMLKTTFASEMEALRKRVADLEAALREVCAIFASDEYQGEALIAHIHGYRVDEEVSRRNGASIARGRALLEGAKTKADV